jgi:GST-like protein
LSSFAIARRWPSRHLERQQLQSLPTPNGVKVSFALEVLGLPHGPHAIDIGKNGSWTPEFLPLESNGWIAASIDPQGPGGIPFGLMESGAIRVDLAEKTGKLMPTDQAGRPTPAAPWTAS